MSLPPLLDVDGVNVWFPVRRGVFSRVRNYVRAVQDVSLRIQEGEVLALVGESGCGKSTLARSILMLQKPVSGTIRIGGKNIYECTTEERKEMRRSTQIVFQDPYASLNPRMPIYQIVTEGLLIHGMMKSGERESVAVELLQDVGLGADAMYRYPHEFSGGQRQRICIARAISMKPRLIVCDEAVSALDVSIQAQVINLLMALKEKYKLSYLFITHDLSVVRVIADRIAVMYLGSVVEQGGCEQVMKEPCHPYTKALLSVIPRVGGERGRLPVLSGEMPSVTAPPPGCPFHTRCPHVMERCRKEKPLPIDRKNRMVSCHLIDL